MTTIILEGKEYQLDIEQAKKLNLLKEKDDRVRSWDEFKEKYSEVLHYTAAQLTKQESIALVAFSKLLKLRRDWIGEWEPDWLNDEFKYTVVNWGSYVKTDYCSSLCKSLSFPTKQMAQEFLETFRDLIEEAKILI